MPGWRMRGSVPGRLPVANIPMHNPSSSTSCGFPRHLATPHISVGTHPLWQQVAGIQVAPRELHVRQVVHNLAVADQPERDRLGRRVGNVGAQLLVRDVHIVASVLGGLHRGKECGEKCLGGGGMRAGVGTAGQKSRFGSGCTNTPLPGARPRCEAAR
eukprot:86495-Chlamydomonas_euryale.AAC.2